ncbi:acetyltransferase (GNAT) domain-containing protein [Purpureocillium lilacinum]|uniref:Acetyltransferase (GNAT) domain-containing protein n=1 Tax=Purpureocillium lilacinum TaxID=33203 RepID=A0A179GC40_PURLI|nr:acetyltransferase (GNAT) domain-containing protein [Purpureocillium lilacinum]
MDVDELRTPRLLLRQLHTNDLGSQDLEWFHRLWSNELATQWRQDHSQQWMAGILPRNATGKKVKIAFAVLPSVTETQTAKAEALGIVTLLSTAFRLASEPAADPEDDGTTVELGYLFHPDSWGNGFATESLREFISAYVKQRAAREQQGDMQFEIRASAHSANGASVRVLEKLGFEELGRFEHEGRLPLRKEASREVILHMRLRK